MEKKKEEWLLRTNAVVIKSRQWGAALQQPGGRDALKPVVTASNRRQLLETEDSAGCVWMWVWYVYVDKSVFEYVCGMYVCKCVCPSGIISCIVFVVAH